MSKNFTTLNFKFLNFHLLSRNHFPRPLKEYLAKFVYITQLDEIVLIMNVTYQRWGVL
jgi:hypothetical protein